MHQILHGVGLLDFFGLNTYYWSDAVCVVVFSDLRSHLLLTEGEPGRRRRERGRHVLFKGAKQGLRVFLLAQRQFSLASPHAALLWHQSLTKHEGAVRCLTFLLAHSFKLIHVI